jgi:YbgC/YbaW family acyl-CoA thioester hydrolase
MSKVFTRSFRVRWSEIDATNRVPASKYLEYLSETAYDWGAANSLGFEESAALGVIWVILETDIRFLHPLRYNDRFDFTIWMVEWRKVRGTRAFELKLIDSDVIIAQGMQQVASLDEDTLRPIALPGEMIDKFKLDEPRSFPSPRFHNPGRNPAGSFRFQRSVGWGDLDSLVHLNNAEAVRYADEAVVQFLKALGWSPDRLISEGMAPVPGRLHIKYQLPGLWGDQLRFETFPTEVQQNGATNMIIVERISDSKGIVQAVYQWRLVDLVTDEERDLPSELHNSLSEIMHERKDNYE